MLVMLASAFTVTANSQLLKKIGDKVKDKTNQKADQTVDKNIDKSEEGTANTNTNSKPAVIQMIRREKLQAVPQH